MNLLKAHKKIALITGVTGQDGSYLAELLLYKQYEVHGIIRRASTFNTRRIDHIFDQVTLHYGDVTDASAISELIFALKPDEVYNLAAQSHVRVSFDTPVYTGDVTALGTARILEAVRKVDKNVRFYQASSSEMFGNETPPQSETTPFAPISPYACAKVYSYWMTRGYREGYGLFACNGILFNHESPRRGPTFVTRKITRAIAEIVAGKRDSVALGNLKSLRDWGYAPDYVEAMWTMLQQDQPGDFVIGTGVSHSVEEFLEVAFSYAGMDWRKHVTFDPRYTRPNEVGHLQASASKAAKAFDWSPSITMEDLAHIMVDADLERMGIQPIGKGVEAIDVYFGGTSNHRWHKWSDQARSMEDR